MAGAQGQQRKLVLVVIDSLRSDILRPPSSPTASRPPSRLVERGDLVEDCVSTFPSVTPVAAAEMTTGTRPDLHAISGVNWFHRVERRYVEYGSSFEATRALGLFRTLYDIVYDMNMAHLSPEVTTAFERLGDADPHRLHAVPDLPRTPPPRARARGRAAAGRPRRQLPPRGLGPRRALLRRALRQPQGRCPPTLARPGTRDPYSACVGRSWPARTSTTSSSSRSPTTTTTPTASGHGDGRTRSPAPTAAWGARLRPGRPRPLPRRPRGDRLRRPRPDRSSSTGSSFQALLAGRWEVLPPNAELTADDQLAVGPSGRGRRDLAAPRRRTTSGPPARRRGPRPPRTRHRRRSTCSPGSTPEGEPTNRWARGQRQPHRASLPARRAGPRPRAARLELDGDPAALSARDRRRPLRQRRLPGCARPPLGGAGEPERRRHPRQPRARLGVRRLGRRRPHPRRQPRLAARRPTRSGRCSPSAWTASEPERLQWAISDVSDLIDGHFGIDD